jgi:hypothetical protein
MISVRFSATLGDGATTCVVLRVGFLVLTRLSFLSGRFNVVFRKMNASCPVLFEARFPMIRAGRKSFHPFPLHRSPRLNDEKETSRSEKCINVGLLDLHFLRGGMFW